MPSGELPAWGSDGPQDLMVTGERIELWGGISGVVAFVDRITEPPPGVRCTRQGPWATVQRFFRLFGYREKRLEFDSKVDHKDQFVIS